MAIRIPPIDPGGAPTPWAMQREHVTDEQVCMGKDDA